MYKRIFTALIAAMLAVFLLFVLGPMAVGAAPQRHIVAHVHEKGGVCFGES